MWKHILSLAGGAEVILGAAMSLLPEVITREYGYVLLDFGATMILVSAVGWWREVTREKIDRSIQPNPGQNPRSLDTNARQRLVHDLQLVANEHTNVDIVFGPGQYHPFAQLLDGVFIAAGWSTNTTLMPQEPHNPQYHGGVEVRGCNRHLVDAVCVALRNVGVFDARINIVPLQIKRDNPKWLKAQHKVYLYIGYVEDGPR
jgi:hypothetical protein